MSKQNKTEKTKITYFTTINYKLNLFNEKILFLYFPLYEFTFEFCLQFNVKKEIQSK